MRKINKKGQMNIGRLFIMVAVMFAFVISLGIIMFFIHMLPTVFQPVAQNMMIDGSNNKSIEAYDNTIGRINEGYAPMRWIPIGILFSMLIATIITFALSRNHPVIIVPYILIVVVAVIFTVPISNFYGGLSSDPIIGSEMDNFLGLSWFFGYLPIIIAVVGLIGGVLIIININRGIAETY